MIESRRTLHRRGVSTITWAVASGVVLAIAVIYVGWLIEPEPTETRRRHRDLDVTDLVTPDALTDAERARATTTPEGSTVKLEDGAWVQVAGPTGTLEQQYSAERIDPLPDGWLKMVRPRAMVYLSGGRIITLRGERGLVSVPQQAIESGTLEGDVVIRLFVPRDGRPVKIEETEPEVIVRTEEASFSNVLGEIRCNKSIRIDAEGASFSGEGLTMLLGDDEQSIERLVVERAIAPIRLTRDAGQDTSSESAETGATEGAAPPPDVAPDAGAPQFYTLELERDVRIEQYASNDALTPDSVVSGHRLQATFSLDGDGLDGADAVVRQDLQVPPSPTMGGRSLLVGSMLGSTVQSAPDSAGLVLIHYTGRMIMMPASDSERLGSVDDVLVEITSGAERLVEVSDAASEAVIACDLLRYRSAEDLIELESAGARPLVVTSPRLHLRGERFRFARRDGNGRLEGPGSMQIHRLDDQDPADPTGDMSDPELEVDWADGVDLRFRPGTEALEEARFDGAVRVDNPDFELVADSLDVRFAADEDRDSIERIIARGSDDEPASASRKSELGMLSARVIDLALSQDRTGRTIPRTMRAEGAVRAQDAEQTLWTDGLDVTFAVAPDTSTERVSGDAGLGGVEIDRVFADHGVHVQLADGARIWADSLLGSGTRRNLTLAAEDGSLLIIRGNVVADQLQALRFDEALREAASTGPGRFRYFEEPIVMPKSGFTRPPAIGEGSLSMEATWGEGMKFDDGANDGAGAIELTGDVIVRNRPEPLEDNDLDADVLRIDFAPRTDVPIFDDQGNPPSEDQLAAFSGSRRMRLLTARGDSRLESRTWSSDERQGEPGLFRITGPFIRYDADSGEGEVDGAGQLLVNQVEDDLLEPKTAEPVVRGVSIGGDGTTRFSWGGDMKMRHQVADRYLVTMNDGVEILHAGLRVDDTLTLIANNLEVLLDRPASTSGSDGLNGSEALDLGGAAKILRVVANGRVFVRTPEQDVECEVFDYDAANQIAKLTARDNRLVSVLNKGGAAPVRAKSVTWDMKTGRIQITGAVGGAGR